MTFQFFGFKRALDEFLNNECGGNITDKEEKGTKIKFDTDKLIFDRRMWKSIIFSLSFLASNQIRIAANNPILIIFSQSIKAVASREQFFCKLLLLDALASISRIYPCQSLGH